MTSSDMQDTPAGRRAAQAGGPRASQPKRRTFTAAYKLEIIGKYDAATGPGEKGALLRGDPRPCDDCRSRLALADHPDFPRPA